LGKRTSKRCLPYKTRGSSNVALHQRVDICANAFKLERLLAERRREGGALRMGSVSRVLLKFGGLVECELDRR